MFPVKAELDLTKYPEGRPGIKLSVNQTYLFGENEDDIDEDILDQSQEFLKEILDKIDYTSTDGEVATDKMELECKVDEDEEDDEDDDDDDEGDDEFTSFPLQHLINKIGLDILKTLP